MTAPNQPAPDGAFVVGGGDYTYGQDYTNDIVKSLFHIPAPTVGTAIDLLQEYLLKLPIEALRAFKDLIPGTIDDDFADVLSAVDTIIDNLQANPVFVKFEEFQTFLWDLATNPGTFLGAAWDLIVTVINAILGLIRSMLSFIGMSALVPDDLPT